MANFDVGEDRVSVGHDVGTERDGDSVVGDQAAVSGVPFVAWGAGRWRGDMTSNGEDGAIHHEAGVRERVNNAANVSNSLRRVIEIEEAV